MIGKTLIVGLALVLAVSSAQAQQRKKCVPGSYWDPIDEKCIYGNGP